MQRIMIVLFIITTGFSLYCQKIITIDSIDNNLGQHVMICQKVVDTFRGTGENKISYLNFGAKFPNNTFSVVIFPKDLPKFPFDPVVEYKDRNICVQGMISFYKEKPQIVVKNPEQIEIIFKE